MLTERYFWGLQPHIRCRKGDIAKIVLLPGELERVERIAAHFDRGSVRKISSHREFRTWTGKVNGEEVSVTSTGVGCPSAAIAVEELINVGAEVLIRVGSTGAIQEYINLGDVIIVDSAVRSDGTTLEYMPEIYPAVADFRVVEALVKAAEELGVRYHVGTVRTNDAFYAGQRVEEIVERYREANVLSFEMECSSIFTVARLRSKRAGAVLGVVGNLATEEHSYRGGEETRRKADLAKENAIRVAVKAVKYL